MSIGSLGQSKNLEARLTSAARSIKHRIHDTSLALQQRAIEYLSYIKNLTKKQLQAFRLAREIRRLEIPYEDTLSYNPETVEGSGILMWLGNKFRRPVYVSLPVALTAIPAVAIDYLAPRKAHAQQETTIEDFLTNANEENAGVGNQVIVFLEWPLRDDNKSFVYAVITNPDGSYKIESPLPGQIVTPSGGLSFELTLCPKAIVPANVMPRQYLVSAPEFITGSIPQPDFYRLLALDTVGEGRNINYVQLIKEFKDPDNIDPATGQPLDGLDWIKLMTCTDGSERCGRNIKLGGWLNEHAPIPLFLNEAQGSSIDPRIPIEVKKAADEIMVKTGLVGKLAEYVNSVPDIGVDVLYGQSVNGHLLKFGSRPEGFYIRKGTVLLDTPPNQPDYSFLKNRAIHELAQVIFGFRSNVSPYPNHALSSFGAPLTSFEAQADKVTSPLGLVSSKNMAGYNRKEVFSSVLNLIIGHFDNPTACR